MKTWTKPETVILASMATVVYKRNKLISIWLLRLLLVGFIASFIYAGEQHDQNLQLLIAVLSLCGVFIPVITITIYQDKVVITRITLFGLNYRSIDCNNVQVFNKTGSMGISDPGIDEPAGCLVMFIAWLPIYKYQWMEAECGNPGEGKETKRASVTISDKEMRILMQTFGIKNVQPGKK